MTLFKYRGVLYPDYLRHGNACQFITPFAKQFCTGRGLDVGAGKWPLDGALPVDDGEYDAMHLPMSKEGGWNYIFSSHCLEHLDDPISALEHWRDCMRDGGVLFLYLPHPDMVYWRPQFCRKHRHIWTPTQMAEIVTDLGFIGVIHSERDLAWSFAVVAWKAIR